MKKYAISFLILIAFGLYLAFSNQHSSQVPSTTPVATVGTPTGTFRNPDIGNINPGTTAPPPPSPAPSTGYKDGTYTGPVADAIYGPLQVEIAVQGGKLTNVTFPQYPNAGGHTSEVNSVALPILAQEAISAQSANVDIVSGATQTSQAFQQSLASALAQAKA